MNFKVEIQNYKKIKKLSHEFEGGNVYVVGGPNNIGKTTFLQGINALATGVSKKIDNVSFGEESGQIKGEFTFDGADGGSYIVKWDFSQNKNQFVIIDPKTNVIKSTPRNNIIAEIFKYNSFTIDEWFGWGLTAEGRRKQASIILNLLPDAAKDEYERIEAEVSSSNGSLFLKRTKLKKKYDAVKTVLDQFELTNEDQDELKKEPAVIELMNKLTKELETSIKMNIPAIKERIENAINSIKQNEEDIQYEKDEVAEIEEQIKALEAKKKTRLENIEKYEREAPILIENKKKFEKELVEADVVEDVDTLKARIEKGKTIIDKIKSIKEKKKTFDESAKSAKLFFDEIEVLDADIKRKRERKVEIIEENELPVSNIYIEDGECFYVDGENHVPFIKDSVSYSEGGMIVINLMAHLNKKFPIWLVGSAESYDDSRLSELTEIAKKHNGIIFLDRVIPDAESELTINAIEV